MEGHFHPRMTHNFPSLTFKLIQNGEGCPQHTLQPLARTGLATGLATGLSRLPSSFGPIQHLLLFSFNTHRGKFSAQSFRSILKHPSAQLKILVRYSRSKGLGSRAALALRALDGYPSSIYDHPFNPPKQQ